MRIIVGGIGLPRGVLSGRQSGHRVRIAAGCDMGQAARRFDRGHSIPICVDHQSFCSVGRVTMLRDTAAGLLFRAAIKPEWLRAFAKGRDVEEVEIPISASIRGGAHITHEFLGDRTERVENFETINRIREFSLVSHGEPTFPNCFVRLCGVEE